MRLDALTSSRNDLADRQAPGCTAFAVAEAATATGLEWQDWRITSTKISLARQVLGPRRARALRLRLMGEDALRESRFAPPREHCLHPEWWHSMDTEATEFEVSEAVAGLIRALQPQYVVETGTSSAQTAIAIGAALKRNGHGRLVSLDIVPENVERGRQLCHGLPVEVRLQSSLDFVPEQPIDFAWFDTVQDMRHLEYRRYHAYMHARTIVGFHDTASYQPTRRFVDELEADGILKAIDLTSSRGFTLGQAIV